MHCSMSFYIKILSIHEFLVSVGDPRTNPLWIMRDNLNLGGGSNIMWEFLTLQGLVSLTPILFRVNCS